MDEFILKNSGDNKEEFVTGAQRDIAEGKGADELISPFFERRLAIILEKGAKHYGPRNWEKGMPFGRTFQSAKRHLLQFLEGQKSEDHLAQCAFNIMVLMHGQEMIERGIWAKELNDLPDYTPREIK